jgi:hypothetical protein
MPTLLCRSTCREKFPVLPCPRYYSPDGTAASGFAGQRLRIVPTYFRSTSFPVRIHDNALPDVTESSLERVQLLWLGIDHRLAPREGALWRPLLLNNRFCQIKS